MKHRQSPNYSSPTGWVSSPYGFEIDAESSPRNMGVLKAYSGNQAVKPVEQSRRNFNEDNAAGSMSQSQTAAAEAGHPLLTSWRVLYPADGAEAMSVVEDLWQRMVRRRSIRCAVLIDPVQDLNQVTFYVDGGAVGEETMHLVGIAARHTTYGWSDAKCKASLVSAIDCSVHMLQLEITPMRQMRRWPNGDTMAWQMQALLQRIQNLGSAT